MRVWVWACNVHAEVRGNSVVSFPPHLYMSYKDGTQAAVLGELRANRKLH